MLCVKFSGMSCTSHYLAELQILVQQKVLRLVDSTLKCVCLAQEGSTAQLYASVR